MAIMHQDAVECQAGFPAERAKGLGPQSGYRLTYPEPDHKAFTSFTQVQIHVLGKSQGRVESMDLQALAKMMQEDIDDLNDDQEMRGITFRCKTQGKKLGSWNGEKLVSA